MKTIFRRLRSLENQLSPPVDEKYQSLVAQIRERRRHDLEASGLPFEEPPPEPLLFVDGRRATLAETIRHSRLRYFAREAESQVRERPNGQNEEQKPEGSPGLKINLGPADGSRSVRTRLSPIDASGTVAEINGDTK
jgi:hypothetical protein